MSDFNRLRTLDRFDGTKIIVGENDYRFFGGTAYLGLANDPDYVTLFKKGIDRFGLNNGTSRHNNVQLGIFDEAESVLAQRFGFQSAALLSSGFLAGQVAITLLARELPVFIAPDAHPALWLYERSRGQRGAPSWLDQTIQEINQSDFNNAVVSMNSLDNLQPGVYDFSALAKLSSEKRITLLMDDSHGLGIINENKVSFPFDLFSLPNVELVVIASLAKGLGTDAGVILGSKQTVEKIKQHPIFVGASPPSPAGIYALVNGEDIYRKAFHKLQANIKFFAGITSGSGLRAVAGFPVFTSSDMQLGDLLWKYRMVISSFSYPLQNSPKLNRIVLSASHSEADLRHLAAILALRPD